MSRLWSKYDTALNVLLADKHITVPLDTNVHSLRAFYYRRRSELAAQGQAWLKQYQFQYEQRAALYHIRLVHVAPIPVIPVSMEPPE